jgi:hypothetical protein
MDPAVRRVVAAAAAVALAAISASASQALLDEKTIAALANEISGESAKRNLEFLSRQHRMRGSRQFRAAAEHIESMLKSYGYADAHIEQFPADGRIFYGTQRSRPPWNAEFAELWEVDGPRIASWEAAPITLAQDSESGEATGDLVESGDVAGKFLLTPLQPGAVASRGAAGIISYAQNQRTAWYGEDENLIRWGHLDTFAPQKTFAFMVSLKQAREFQRRLAAGQTIRLRAVVRAGQAPGFYDIPMTTIAGTDPAAGEIIYSCHLDHPRPGANDNASGCVAILEVARTLRKLIDEKRLPAPRRTIRFVWPPEIEGTTVLLNARPELAQRIRAAIHLDMVGGGPVTKAIFHVTRGPGSLPSFVNDVAEEIGRFVNDETAKFASTGTAAFPLHAPEGGKEALQAEFAPFSMGSDHQIYTDSSFSIPAIYLNDWPDRYIHTNFDVPANIDPTKLKRAAFIAAASGWFLANFTANDVPKMTDVVQANELRRRADMMTRRRGMNAVDGNNLTRFHNWYEQKVIESIWESGRPRPQPPIPPGGPKPYRRNPKIKGPVSVFGYDYLEDKYGKEKADKLKLPGQYAYEALNLADGVRTTQQIRDDLSAIYGPVPLEAVEEYLQALESIGILMR